MIDLALLIVIGLVTWCVAAEGAWGAGTTFLIVVFSGLLAMNFFEPVAGALESGVAATGEWRYRWDIIALVGLFTALVFGLRMLAEQISPRYITCNRLMFDAGRWVFAAFTGYATAAFLLAALHTAPLPREFMGFQPERKNLFGLVAPDRQWLGFTQYASEKIFRQPADRVFDGPKFEFEVAEYELKRWPSFPIRYASRREELGRSGGGAAAGGSGDGGLKPRSSSDSGDSSSSGSGGNRRRPSSNSAGF
ncbi:MAG: CvpA family protein [Planctomycetaceae bacterium]|nr:CvpA family protein [Planctomycetaceae bacterium]